MGLKNAGSQFQRMMEWVLRDHPNAHAYLDDVLVGSEGANTEELIENHRRDVRAVLQTMAEHRLVCSPKKSQFFMREVEFCGHILREGLRKPAPGKLLPIQNWEIPKNITELRGFLGLTNWFAEYVPRYAEDAAPLMGKLKVSRIDGRKGSKKPVTWEESDILAFERLKAKLAQALALYQPDVSRPFTLKVDASEHAIGAALMQEFDGVLRPVAFFSRKLAKNQLNWAIKEKEMYAVVASLRKFSGLINFQPVVVETDHRALEHWVSEHVDTPSGPRGRRGRWHEILSQFDLEIRYVPWKENELADAMSRWAYPATSARSDVSWHGNIDAHREVQETLQREDLERRQVAVIRRGEVTWEVEDETLTVFNFVTPAVWWVRPIFSSGERPKFEFKAQRERRAREEREREDSRQEDPSEGAPASEPPTPRASPPGQSASGTGFPSEDVPPTRIRRRWGKERATREFESENEPTEVERLAPSSAAEYERGVFGLPEALSPELRDSAQEATSSSRRTPRFQFAPTAPTMGSSSELFVLDEDWSLAYESSTTFGPVWRACHVDGGKWEVGFQLIRGKLYRDGLLCVPGGFVERVLLAHHVMVGHPGIKRLKLEVRKRYIFPTGMNVEEIIGRVRRECLICQACDPPNRPFARPVRMSPIIEGFMSSVSLDVFSMMEVTWQDATFDCVVLCVDRATGWIIARPAQYSGLTGERAAHLLLDQAWGEVGIPAVVTSDQGPQFVNSWWKTMCARLGVRQAFSQAHRPQANGRAETAGKTVRGILRKLHTEFSLNWVEALPRVLRIHHDLPTVTHGFSPYELVFGRERPTAGLPVNVDQRSPSAEEFFEHMERLDVIATQMLRDEVQKEEERMNQQRDDSPIYRHNDWVWLHRPTAFGGAKMQTSWMGPYRVLRRVGEHSYVLRTGGRVEQEVHVDQIKPCQSNESSATWYPMVYRRGDPFSQLPETRVAKVLGFRDGENGPKLKVVWEGVEEGGDCWIPVTQMGGAVEKVVELFIQLLSPST